MYVQPITCKIWGKVHTIIFNINYKLRFNIHKKSPYAKKVLKFNIIRVI